jgi:hypothetical protein
MKETGFLSSLFASFILALFVMSTRIRQLLNSYL